MAESDKKMFSVRNVRASDREEFKELAKRIQKSPADTVSYLLELSRKQPQTGENTDQIQNEIISLNEQLQGLQAVNESLQNQLNDKTAALDAVNSGPKGSPNAFLFDPDPPLYARMRRCIAYLIQKGKFKKSDSDLPQKFTARALEFSIDTEFENIQK